MATFKDVLIKDARQEGTRNLQFQHPSMETKGNQDLLSSRMEPSSTEDEIPDIDEVGISDCERFENMFLIGKIIGQPVPLKTIVSKIKADWLLTGEIRFLDMGNGFTQSDSQMKWTVIMLSLVNLGLSKDKF